jgi:hypothetical protein
MDHDRADYDDGPGRGRRPWTPLQVAILVAIVLVSLPAAAVVALFGAIALSGGMQQ